MSSKKGRLLPGSKSSEQIKAWMIMLPSLILMTFFVWEPLFESVRMSLYKTRNVELVRFIWFDNYISVMKKDDFLQALMNTFSYTFWSLLIGFLLPIVLAILIGETRRCKGIFRTVAYLPNMLPGLAVVILWSSFFSGGATGVLNILLSAFDIPPQTYLTRAEWVIPIIIMIATWKGAGATALIYMASIAGISPELYEAATIDGASQLQTFFRIVLPLSKPICAVIAIFAVNASWSDFLLPYLVLRGAQMQTVMVRLFVFSTEQTVNADAMMRSVVFSMIPPIILFFIFQKQLTENAVSVGIKG